MISRSSCRLFLWLQVLWLTSWGTPGLTQNPLDKDLLLRDIPEVVEFRYQPEKRVWWSRVAQFQLRIPLKASREDGLYKIAPAFRTSHRAKIERCLKAAVERGAHIAIFPELTLSLEAPFRQDVIDDMRRLARPHDMIIIGGSFYDPERRSRCVIITPEEVVLGQKIRPARSEAMPVRGFGMQEGTQLAYLRTKYGNFMVILCSDLISDDVQYIIRRMANLGLLDLCANITYNKASWEFMREASGIVKRHPLFFTITNVDDTDPVPQDEGISHGNTSVYASIHQENFR